MLLNESGAYLVGAQSYRLSTVNAHIVAVKPVMGK